jgi:hypothetical protein
MSALRQTKAPGQHPKQISDAFKSAAKFGWWQIAVPNRNAGRGTAQESPASRVVLWGQYCPEAMSGTGTKAHGDIGETRQAYFESTCPFHFFPVNFRK